MGGNWLDIDQTAVHFGVAAKTVRRWIERRDKLKMTAEKRRGKWYADVDSISFREPASQNAIDSALVGNLERQLEAEKRRADAALAEAGTWRGRYEEIKQGQDQLLLEHKQTEQTATAEIERLAEEIGKLKSRGFWARLLNK